MSIHAPNTSGRAQLDTLFSSLSHRDRRRVLGMVCERTSQALTPRDLAVALCDWSDQQSDDRLRQHRVTLKHSHLPKLEDANLIKWDRAAGAVRSEEHEALRDTDIRETVTGQESFAPSSVDALFSCLAANLRRTTLDVLEQHDRPIDVETLAREVRNAEQTSEQESARSGEQLRVTLHHNHLPKLADADLISYDTEESVVEYEGHPLLESGDYVPSVVFS